MVRPVVTGVMILLLASAVFAHTRADTNGDSDCFVVMKVRSDLGSLLPADNAVSSGITSLDSRLNILGVRSVRRLHPHAIRRDDLPRLDLVVELALADGADPKTVVNALKGRPELEYVTCVEIPKIEEVPDDPLYGSQPHLPQISAPAAWDVQKGDSTVVIAIIDNGTDITHPDLFDNVFTNELEANGAPGVDDDGNGYIDDIHGYDVSMNDPDPMPCPPDPEGWWDHGTLTAGAAAAVTDNGLGVAAPSWNCEVLPVKASFDNNPGSISGGYAGITYAAETGAHIINCSWGHHGSPDQYSQDVIDYATGLGSLVLASAGNEAIGDPHWPSSYLNTISVTWVDVNDRRAWGATWGSTVDMSAPGVNIRTTAPNGGYGNASGSSLSCPVAAGVAGLIKSQHPEFGPYELGRQLVLTSDNIDDVNPGFEGLLGIGRVNAYRAVTEIDLQEYPSLDTWAWTVSDSAPDGNGDGWIMQGETGSLWITYRSYTVSPAEDAIVTLTTTAPGIELDVSSIMPGSIPADCIGTLAEPFKFTVSANAPAQRAPFVISYAASGGYTHLDTVYVSLGQSPVLLVDDDDGEVNVEEYYMTVLDSLDIPFLVWDRSRSGAPDASTLINFPVVVWLCEWAFPSLEIDDRAALTSYLESGGLLYMSGQDIGWNLCDPASEEATPDAISWYNTYLHAEYLADNANNQSVEGIPGDVISHGMSFNIFQPGRDAENQYPSVIEPFDDDTYPVFRYRPGDFGAVRYREEYGVVYTAFGFEAVASGQGIDPVDYSGTRTELMARILNYLNPIRHQPLPDIEDYSQPVTVTAELTGTAALDSLWLYWKTDQDLEFAAVTMNATGGDMFTGDIPSPVEATDIMYYLEARSAGLSIRLPVIGDFRFHAGPDEIAPQLHELTILEDAFQLNGTRTVNVLAGDNLGIDPASGLLHWIAGDTEGTIPMDLDEWIGPEARLTADFPVVGSYGDTVYYYCSVEDMAQESNTGMSQQASYIYGFEGFEYNLNLWDPGTGWGRQSGGTAHTGDWIVTDSPGGAYGNNEDNSLTLLDGCDLSAYDQARLCFWVKYGLENGEDFCYIDASLDGETWTTLLSLTGRELSWTYFDVSLSEFTGDDATDVLIRFRLVSDEEGTDAGVYLDDVMVDTGALPADQPPVPVTAELIASPVPSSESIQFSINGFEGVPRIEVYDLAGRLVTRLTGSAGRNTVSWDTRASSGNHVRSGIYLARIAGTSIQEKVVIIR